MTQARTVGVESQPRASEIKWLRIPPICSLDAWLTLSHRQTHEIPNPVTPG